MRLSRLVLASGLMAGVLGAMAPGAAACIMGSMQTYALREAPPEQVERGEVVLELDRRSIVSGNGWTQFSVARVVVGEYAEPTIRIPSGLTSCDRLAHADSDAIVVGKIRTRENSPTAIVPRRQRDDERRPARFGGRS